MLRRQEVSFFGLCILSEDYDTTLIDYANGMMMWGDFYRSEKIYRDALQQNPGSLDLALKLAWSLASQQR